MINFNDVTEENIKEHNPNWPQILDHLYRILIIGGAGSGKTNLLFNLTQSYFTVPRKYYSKFYTLFHYENSKQTGASTNCI